jgi:chromate reductase
VVSASSSASAVWPNHHLRQSLVFLNVPAMAPREAYTGWPTVFRGDGKLANGRNASWINASSDF